MLKGLKLSRAEPWSKRPGISLHLWAASEILGAEPSDASVLASSTVLMFAEIWGMAGTLHTVTDSLTMTAKSSPSYAFSQKLTKAEAPNSHVSVASPSASTAK